MTPERIGQLKGMCFTDSSTADEVWEEFDRMRVEITRLNLPMKLPEDLEERLVRIQQMLDQRFYASGADLEREIWWLTTAIRSLRALRKWVSPVSTPPPSAPAPGL